MPTPVSRPDLTLCLENLAALTPADFGKRLGIARKTVDRMILDGQVTAIYPRGQGRGRPVRIPISELRRIIEGGDAR